MGTGSTPSGKAATVPGGIDLRGGIGVGGSSSSAGGGGPGKGLGSGDGGDLMSSNSNANIIRACDQCRIRKIRCDKESPCSNCRIANRQCSSTGAGQKPREARQRVLISTQYERKIDQIEERLGSIEKLLRELTLTSRNTLRLQTTLPLHEHPPVVSPDADRPSPTPDGTTDLDSSAFEGHSSLTAHSQFASEFLESAVERTSLRDVNPNMAAALSSLRQMVGLRGSGSGGAGSARDVRFAHQRVLPRGGFRELPMPPVTAVIPILREVKETPPGTFTLISVCCFMAVENFAEACRRVYFALEDFSHATFIIVNAGLYYLFQEKSVTAATDAAVREYTGYYELCRANLETGLAHLRFFLGATMETIEALLLGASYAIEVSRPSLAWQLNTTAAQLCQDLGYHRVTGGTVGADGSEPSSVTTVLDDKKAILFWFSYMLDRGLALRLGRAPIIQDFDVTLPRVIGRVNATEMWKEVLRLWIAHADVQGQIYERLYSPASLAHPPARRADAARTLAARLKIIEEQASLLRTGDINRHARDGTDARKVVVAEMVMKSDQVSFLSSLTLVYRAIPSRFPGASTFAGECIDTARLAMQTHEECMKLMGSNLWVAASYIHWTILYAPFVPFIVIFCHIIETSDVADLHRLREFIDSLQPTCAVSEGIEKLHRLFSVLYNVAMLYVEAKGRAGQHQDTDMAPIGNEFDVYLSALGFMPVDDPSGSMAAAAAAAAAANGGGGGGGGGGGHGTNAGAMTASQQTTQLGDWFSGNRYMMGLLEEDLSQFHPNTWNSGV
ncbi:hypothetical protein M406DRAFT_95615 [Cryphonectria parasitica EP155]|uniref:Zn(2)-C6 fungal-type domain-containing protein n=1 Tax=Cryphonectria parasitica (strain ATCC 38755 / EP155) TaxID=660469 RepID=A0A9P4XS48_CRYP1|nr:uncharacterized protein M406DRAFT_95615 [Cryphonectria parasitica EP155]KAF3759989.1 hypothetical protein M406DRAFT_95615 [Cryphonectria parasitica EP155]